MAVMDKKTTNAKKAFRWIINILKKHKIPFQITGGLAAHVYGSNRQLNDIDIEIPENRFNDILSDVKKYINFGPSQYVDERWNVFLLTLNYKDQKIDISSAFKVKICDARTKKWRNMPSNFKKRKYKLIFGENVPVVTKDDLIAYKNILKRKEDKQDIKAILKSKKRS